MRRSAVLVLVAALLSGASIGVPPAGACPKPQAKSCCCGGTSCGCRPDNVPQPVQPNAATTPQATSHDAALAVSAPVTPALGASADSILLSSEIGLGPRTPIYLSSHAFRC